MTKLLKLVQSSLTKDLLKKKYLPSEADHPTTGHCYVAAEALYHLMEKKVKPMVIPKKVYGITHWFLVDKQGNIHDPTKEQFDEEIIRYDLARPCGFLTKQPSKRAQIVIERVIKKMIKS